MASSRDYSGSTRRKRSSSRGNTTSKSNGSGSHIVKFFIILFIAIVVIAGLVVLRMNATQKSKDQQVKETPKANVVDEKPQEKYSYRKLLEEKQIKTVDPNVRKEKNIAQAKQNQPELIIDRNPDLSEYKKARQETKEQEAKRALEILNGSLTNPREEQVRTVKIDPNGNSTLVQKNQGQPVKVASTTTSDKLAVRIEEDSIPVSTKPKTSEVKSENKANEIKVLDRNTLQPQTKSASTQPAKAVVATNIAKNTNTTKTVTQANNAYAMQCGAFKTNEQASTLKAKIVAKGQASHVEKANTANGVWYRVIVDQFPTKNVANDVYAKLKAAKIVNSCNIYKAK